ncbi:MAG: hypothetical protein JWM34_3719 [Ilumatobacteraceae bacterium]|nr:hypothetical protein [Ilumatobacteraceae bacterium]
MPWPTKLVAAHSATGRTKHGLGWVPWIAGLLLIVIIAAGLLWALNINDTNDKPGLDINNDSSPATVIYPPPTNNESTALITTGAAA